MSPGSKVEATCDELNADDKKVLSARSVAFLMPNPPCLTGREDCVHASWSNLMLMISSRNFFITRSYSWSVARVLNVGALLKKYVNLGIAKQHLRRNTASWASIVNV